MNFHCSYCGEPILNREAPFDRFCNTVMTSPLHRECGFRMVCGSIAHIEHRCSCYIEGSQENDPPGLTLREAARAAFEKWQEINAQPSEETGALGS